MDPLMQRHAQEALEAIDAVLRAGADVEHAAIQAATNAVIAMRDRAIAGHRAGMVSRDLLDRANALVSLAYGAEFPLSGLHLHRLERTRDGVRLLGEARDGSPPVPRDA